MIAPIYFDNGFQHINEFLSKNHKAKVFFVVDENTHEFCLPHLLAELSDLNDMEIIEIPAGEDAKSIEIAYQVWESLSELGADRKSIIINCGGGVVTDFGGFIAATFKRGIPFIQVPTSLLAMVDASVGSKTGINLGHIKNQIGTFSQAEMVIIEPNFLQTLPEREFLSGFAEMLKHGLIADKILWKDLIQIENLNAENLAPWIPKSIQIKEEIVALDPKEQGLRKILNVGHTLGHALETYFLETQNPLTHGEAVALGILLESHLALQMGILNQSDFNEIWQGISKFYYQVELPDLEQILPILLHDKKNQNQQVNFVFLTEIGKAEATLYQVEIDQLQKAFDFYKNQKK